jgi:hypothetical protein
VSAARPANSNVRAGISLTYRIGAAKTYTASDLKLLPNPEKPTQAWGVYIFNNNGNPTTAATTYAATIAHELGHLMGLAHNGGPVNGNDGIKRPQELNLMSTGSANPQIEDLDLAQALAIQGSGALVPG